MGAKGVGKKPPTKHRKKLPKTWIHKEAAVDKKGKITGHARMRVYYPGKFGGTADKNYVTNESMLKARETYKKRGIKTRKLPELLFLFMTIIKGSFKTNQQVFSTIILI